MTFTEHSPESWAQEREQLLQRKICELGLKIEGTRIARLIRQLYEGLDAAGIAFKPKVYLADEWGLSRRGTDHRHPILSRGRFAETFAVWLDPDSNWREVYKDWGCYPKLEYVDHIVREIGGRPALVSADDFDTSQDLACSVADHDARCRHAPPELPAYFDADLKEIFDHGLPQQADRIPAHQFLEQRRRDLVANIGYWTGLSDIHIRSLIAHFIQRTHALGLWVDPAKSKGSWSWL